MKTRANQASAVLEHFDRVMLATETAYNSTGSAARENAKVLESLNGHIQQMKSEWESLVNSKGTQDTLKFFVDLTTNVIKLVKALGGIPAVLAAITVALAIMKKEKIMASFTEVTTFVTKSFATITTFVTNLIPGLKLYVATLNTTSTALITQAQATQLATARIFLFNAAIAVSVAAIAGLIWYINSLSKAFEENQEAARNAAQAYEEEHKKTEDLKSQLSDIEKQIREINEHPIDIAKQEQLDRLKEQSEELRTQLAIQERLESIALKESNKAAKEAFTKGSATSRELEKAGLIEKQGSYMLKGAVVGNAPGALVGLGMDIAAYNVSYGTVVDQAEAAINKEIELTKVWKKQEKQYKERLASFKGTDEEYKKLLKEKNDAEDEYNKKIELNDKILKDNLKVIDENTKNLDKNDKENKVLLESIDRVNQKVEILNNLTKENNVVVENNNKVVTDNIQKIDLLSESYEKNKEALLASIASISTIYKDLSSAIEEYNENGHLSITTLANLMDKYPDYLEILEENNFSEQALTEAIREKIQMQINEMQAEADATLQIANNNKINLEAAKAALKNAEAQGTLAKTYAALSIVLSGTQVKAIQDYMKLQEEIDKLQKALDNTTSFKQDKDTTSGAKKQVDEWKEAFLKAYDDLKHRRTLDLIDTETYINELTVLNDKYFKDRQEYEEEYNKYIEELYKERQNLFKEQINDLVFALNMLENKGANKQTLIAKNKEIQEELHKQAEYYRSLGLKENNDLITSLQEQWWKYQKNIENLEKDIASQIEKTNKEIKKQLEEEIDLLDERFKALKDYAIEGIEKEIEEKENWLENQNKLLDEQIDKYKEEEDTLDNQKTIEDKLLKIEEARKKLAEAKNKKVRVYREGKGFVYESDFDAVAQAQSQLDELLKDWNLFQDKAKIANIIAELEAEKEANEKRVNDEIVDLNNLKDAWDKSLDISKEVEDYQGWLTKIKESESQNYSERLRAIKEFVTSYNNEMNALQTKYTTSQETNEIIRGDSNSTVSSTGTKSYGGVTYFENLDYQKLINDAKATGADEAELRKLETKRNAKIAGEGSNETQTSVYGGTTFTTPKSSGGSSSSGKTASFTIGKISSSTSSGNSSSGNTSSSSSSKSSNLVTALAGSLSSVANAIRKVTGLAGGTNEADGLMHLVGENGPELYIPPQGSSIIPNLGTENLISWSKLNPMQLVSSFSGNGGTNINIDNISLPNVSNANEFVNELKNFRNLAVQRESKRR